MSTTTLFATTALVGAAWLVTAAAAGPSHPTQPAPNPTVDIGSFPAKDTNSKFLCNYGYPLRFDASSSGNSTYSWTVAAVPIIGTGKVVNEIVVADSGYSSVHYGFYVELLENDSKTNTPGIVIAKSTQANTGGNQCAKIKVPIPPARLKAGETYWVEEFATVGWDESAIWQFDKTAPPRGLSQLDYCNLQGSCYYGPWQAIRGGYEPYVRVR